MHLIHSVLGLIFWGWMALVFGVAAVVAAANPYSAWWHRASFLFCLFLSGVAVGIEVERLLRECHRLDQSEEEVPHEP